MRILILLTIGLSSFAYADGTTDSSLWNCFSKFRSHYSSHVDGNSLKVGFLGDRKGRDFLFVYNQSGTPGQQIVHQTGPNCQMAQIEVNKPERFAHVMTVPAMGIQSIICSEVSCRFVMDPVSAVRAILGKRRSLHPQFAPPAPR